MPSKVIPLTEMLAIPPWYGLENHEHGNGPMDLALCGASVNIYEQPLLLPSKGHISSQIRPILQKQNHAQRHRELEELCVF